MSELKPKELIKMMDEVINIRRYKDVSIPEDKIVYLLEAFRHGASTANQQPWEILILNEEQKSEIIHATLDPFYRPTSKPAQSWIKEVPLLLLVTMESRRTNARFGNLGIKINEQDAFTAVQNLRIMASFLGLSSAIIREFDHDHLSNALHLPWNFTPLTMISIGYSDEQKEYPPRLAIEEFVHWGKIN